MSDFDPYSVLFGGFSWKPLSLGQGEEKKRKRKRKKKKLHQKDPFFVGPTAGRQTQCLHPSLTQWMLSAFGPSRKGRGSDFHQNYVPPPPNRFIIALRSQAAPICFAFTSCTNLFRIQTILVAPFRPMARRQTQCLHSSFLLCRILHSGCRSRMAPSWKTGETFPRGFQIRKQVGWNPPR